MATIKQINANRKNALLSKGPKTDLGKLNSSKNSLKHGLTAKQLVIGEDLKEFEQYRDLMIEALKPEGILEEQKLKEQKEKERRERNRAAYNRERKYVFWPNAYEQGNYISIHSEKFNSKDKKYQYY